MRCKICGSFLSQPTYREIYPYFNFPAHSSENWDACRQSLLNNNFHSIYNELPKLLDFSPRLSAQHKPIKELLQSRDTSFELLMKVDELQTMLNDTFPDATIAEPRMYVPAEVQLDMATYQKLLAHELEYDTKTPVHLKHTTQHILQDMQTGELSLDSPFYYGTVPASRSIQSIRVPVELVKALRQPWISGDRALERVLMEFAERVETLEQNEDVAYLILKNDIRPSTIKRKARGTPVSATINYIRMPGLPGEKRGAIRKALQSLDIDRLMAHINQVEGNVRSSCRVDYEDKLQIDKLSKQLKVPSYKLTTGLLLCANYVKV